VQPQFDKTAANKIAKAINGTVVSYVWFSTAWVLRLVIPTTFQAAPQ